MGKLISKNNGFSTLELMISLALICLVLSAVILISFGNQSFIIASQNNSEALKIAQGLIEKQQALARKDFNLVNPFAPETEGIYEKSIEVKLLPDFLTKEIKTIISWKNENQLENNLILTTLLSDFNSPAGNNTCDSTLSGNWNMPIVDSLINFSSFPNIPNGTYTLTNVDVYKNKLYVTAGQTGSEISLPTLFIFDISDKNNPILLGKTDNAPNVSKGLNAILVSEDLNSNPIKTYAYAGSNTSSNYSTCNPVSNQACGQIYIFDVTNPTSINSKINLKIISDPAIEGQVVTKIIFYKNNYLFLGLQKNDGPEFQIIDVRHPNLIISGPYQAIGNFEIGNDINDIYIKNNFSYIASPNNQELKILDITNLTTPSLVGGFDVGSRNGKSLYLVGDRLYLGKADDISNDKDFYILNNKNPENSLSEISSTNILGSSINNLIVRSNLGFFLTNSTLEIFNTGDPTSLSPFNLSNPLTSFPLSISGGTIKPSMDCEGNYLYITSNDISGKGYLSIITSS